MMDDNNNNSKVKLIVFIISVIIMLGVLAFLAYAVGLFKGTLDLAQDIILS